VIIRLSATFTPGDLVIPGMLAVGLFPVGYTSGRVFIDEWRGPTWADTIGAPASW